MIYENLEGLKQALHGVLAVHGGNCDILSDKKLREKLIDDLIQTAVFASEGVGRPSARGASLHGRSNMPQRSES